MDGLTFVNDLLAAARGLRRTPGITVAAVVSLALGLGGTAAAFMLADALLFEPFPVLREPEELVGIHRRAEERPDDLARFSHPDAEAYVEAHGEAGSPFSGLTAFSGADFVVGTGGPSRRVPGVVAAPGYFRTLGVRPALGRFFGPAEPEDPLVAVLSDSLWHGLFGGDPEVVGRTLRVNGQDLIVMGVAPPGFEGTDKTVSPRLWIPLSGFRQVMTGPFAKVDGLFDRRQEWLAMVGRLAPGATLEQARASLDRVAKQLATAHPETNRGETAVTIPVVRTAYGVGKWREMTTYCLLIGAVALVTLIVAALDVANLLLARGLLRRRELGIRRVLGARRGQLVRLLGLETLLLVLVASVLALGTVHFAVPLLERATLPVDVVLDLEVDGRVLAALALVSGVGAALLVGLASLGAMRADPGSVLREHSALSTRRRYGASDLLLAFQAALATSVLIGAGLLFQTMENLRGVAPELFEQDALVATVDLNASGYEGYELDLFHEDLIRSVESHPLVESATVVSGLPLAGSDLEVNLTVAVEGSSVSTEDIGVRHVLIDEDFLETLGVAPVRGRGLGSDTAAAGGVLLNRTAARELFRGRDPVGSRVYLTPKDGPFPVVGVIPDLPFADLREQPTPVLYLDRSVHDVSFVASMLAPTMTLVARTDGAPSVIVDDVRRIVTSLDQRLPLTGVATLADVFAEETALEDQTGRLLASFGLVALLLALVGLYSLVTHAVVRRTREIGLRRALGAGRGEAIGLLLRRTSLPFVAGVLAGLALSVWGSGLLQSQLFGVPQVAPAIYLSVALGVTCLAVLVGLLAGRRALRIEPLVALRES